MTDPVHATNRPRPPAPANRGRGSAHRIAAVLVLLCLGVSAQAPASPSSQDLAAQRATLADMRLLGNALMAWLTEETAKLPRVERETPSQPSLDRHVVDIGSLAVLASEELADMLVPGYLQEMPELDGWGNHLEVRLDPRLPGHLPSPALAIRSGGADGVFDADAYEPGQFPATEVVRDIVWVDGYFVSLPSAPH